MGSITSQTVSAQVVFDMMQKAVATYPKVNMGYGRKRIPSLLDSDNQVALIYQRYFELEILAYIIPSSGEKAEAHQLFQLAAINNGKLPMSMYIKLVLPLVTYTIKYFQCMYPHVDPHVSPPTAHW